MKKLLALIMAVVMLAAMAPMALAASVASITISVPEIKGLQITLTKVQDKYSHEEFMFDKNQTPYFFYFEKGGTVSFSKKVTLSFVDMKTYATSTKDYEANKPITVDDSFTGADLYYDDATKGFVGFVSLDDTVRNGGASACSLDINKLKVAAAATPSATPTTPATPVAPAGTQAVPSAQKVTINGKAVAFDAYNIDGSNYFKLRDLAKALSDTTKKFEVGYDNGKITLTTNKAYTVVGGELVAGDGKAKTANPSTATVYLDGAKADLTAYNISDNNYFKLRDIGKAMNFSVIYDTATSTITIDTAKAYTP